MLTECCSLFRSAGDWFHLNMKCMYWSRWKTETHTVFTEENILKSPREPVDTVTTCHTLQRWWPLQEPSSALTAVRGWVQQQHSIVFNFSNVTFLKKTEYLAVNTVGLGFYPWWLKERPEPDHNIINRLGEGLFLFEPIIIIIIIIKALNIIIAYQIKTP